VKPGAQEWACKATYEAAIPEAHHTERGLGFRYQSKLFPSIRLVQRRAASKTRPAAKSFSTEGGRLPPQAGPETTAVITSMRRSNRHAIAGT
jgi:hypothetical protein